MNSVDPSVHEAFGALCEGVHLAGYSFERARSKLEWLLEDDRWRSVGGGYDNVNAFMDSIRLDQLKGPAESRKRIAARIKELQPQATNRQIARTLGVGETTVRRDTAPNGAPDAKNKSNTSDQKGPPAPSGAPALSGAAAARAVEARETKDERNAQKVVVRQQREAALAAKQLALPDRKYGVILADPEWRFEPYSRDTGMAYAADNHYPTSTLDQIKARDVPSIAAADCALFLWATVPILMEAREVMVAWGFDYKSNIVWEKDRAGTGYWVRNQHEHLLIGTKGNVPAPAPGTQWPSVIRAPVREHSRKPDEAYDLIESYFPTLPKIELNCRGAPRPRWDGWGDQVEAAS